jgi:hypothetical protein
VDGKLHFPRRTNPNSVPKLVITDFMAAARHATAEYERESPEIESVIDFLWAAWSIPLKNEQHKPVHRYRPSVSLDIISYSCKDIVG